MKPANDTCYEGRLIGGIPVVKVNNVPLKDAHQVKNHSPDGFAWGYGGSGPSQLALAILVDFLEDIPRALTWYQPFKWRIVAQWPRDAEWFITGREIVDVLKVLEAETKNTN